MSSWTHVYGLIEVLTFARSNAEAVYIAQTVIDHLPKITGSERDAEVRIMHFPEHPNCSSSYDEFDNYIPGGMIQWRSDALVIVRGDLRDRKFEQTLKECVAFTSRLSKRLSINGGTLKIIAEYGNREFDVLSGKWWDENYESENNWTEFLRWRTEEK